jgi:serine/threonine protein kinase
MLTGIPPFNGKTAPEVLAKVKLGRYSEETLKDLKVSQACRTFISKCLKHSPKMRFSAREAISDPWITKHVEDAAGAEIERNRQLLEMQKFSNVITKKL